VSLGVVELMGRRMFEEMAVVDKNTAVCFKPENCCSAPVMT
jgi:hypothetical protein